MRKNMITKTKRQIDLENRMAREQEQLQKMIDAMNARQKKLEDKLRGLISTEFTKILPDFADYADDELEQIIMAAMQSKECRDKIREIRNSSVN